MIPTVHAGQWTVLENPRIGMLAPKAGYLGRFPRINHQERGGNGVGLQQGIGYGPKIRHNIFD